MKKFHIFKYPRAVTFDRLPWAMWTPYDSFFRFESFADAVSAFNRLRKSYQICG